MLNIKTSIPYRAPQQTPLIETVSWVNTKYKVRSIICCEAPLLQEDKASCRNLHAATGNSGQSRTRNSLVCAHLFCDSMRRLDDLGSDPGQGAALAGDIADVGVMLLLGQPKIGDLAHRAPVAIAQQQVCALQVKMHDALLVQILHALRDTLGSSA